MRGVTYQKIYPWDSFLFQLTRLMRGVTPPTGGRNPPAGLFQLTRLMRGVTQGTAAAERSARFQLTRLMRGVTWVHLLYTEYSLQFQLTRLMRGVTGRL